MNALIPKYHCTQIAVDYIPIQRKKDENTLSDYVKREKNYDLSFSEAWINHINTKPIDDAEQLLKFLMKIQETAMKHVKVIGKTTQGLNYQEGIYVHNSYSVNNLDLTSDSKGIEELVRQIWFDKKETMITTYSEKKEDGFHDMHYLNNMGFYKRDPRNKINTEIYPNNSSVDSFNKILNVIQEYYNIGVLKDGSSPLRIQSMYGDKESKKAKAVELFREYSDSIGHLTTDEEKISKICYLCRELEQLHLFHDGNGRSEFILANILACWNGLDPFYPSNMCIFSANSLEKMVQEVFEGQKRFISMFGSKEQLTNDLKKYKTKVESLIKFSNKKFSKYDLIMKSIGERSFNLLLRQSAVEKSTYQLLDFLLKDLSTLNIDINSKGEKSGNTAMDVAITHENQEAVKLLKKYSFY